MKTIGLLGGMSWESTSSYYTLINQGVKARLGGLHCAKIFLHSVNFDDIEKLQHEGNWQETAKILTSAAKSIEQAGADFLMICTNTMHKVAPDIERELSIPILHIADATAQFLLRDNISKVGLLGTRFTMEQEFYKGRITDKFAIDVVVPNKADQQIVHDVIYNELCQGTINPQSKVKYINIINALAREGAQAVILGCTEIALLVQQCDTDIILYDTTQIHATLGVELALAE
ncbi:aspartate/glutamate racemase family protein [Pseudoalteromonas sp. NEC-BIFX-2020_015]|uniref:aspartate/glutamate racemase family protein n=1 Tax=Pseudoalteromonas sp. NEC-BIFX-2020_015 TaxID=2729544 RepID=UPI0014613B9B|nr:aspartate/glutamate racemase family protein [Pseudoalteromonas sp. NEC-BIFX-2020_015]NMR24328.1 aspartate/glutamate racemase family protein [Pseudoalteromonas sp. NEC-BIFX-2020_015]